MSEELTADMVQIAKLYVEGLQLYQSSSKNLDKKNLRETRQLRKQVCLWAELQDAVQTR